MARPLKPIPILTPEQLKLVEDNFHKNIRELVQLVFNDPTLTLRNDAHVKAIKQGLAGLGKHVNEVPSEKEAELLDQLTEENREYIRNNYSVSSPLEMARLIFQNDRLLLSSKQVQIVALYCRQLDPVYRKEEEMAEDLEYQPPKSLSTLMGRVNRYAVSTRGDGRALFDPAKITPSQTQQLECLMSYMRMPLFKVEADKFVKKVDRDVFESTFIQNCWDKPDLPAEHVIQFIQLSSLIVKYNQTDRTAQKVDLRLNTALENDESLKMNDVETLNGLREKTAGAMKQINALIKSLTGERARMTEERRAGSASMHNLVASWKQEEDRKKIIELANRKQRAALSQEVERLSTMDSLKAEIFGLSKTNILL